MQKKLMSVIWMGWKGYGGKAMHSAASPMEKSVLVRKSAAERWRLLMARRPSATTAGMLAKSLSTSTSSATLRAASEPAAIGHGAVGLLEREHVVHAVARHGHRVPAPLEGLHELALLLRGHAAEHVVAVDRGRRSSMGVSRVVASTYASAPGTPTTCAIEETVRGSSPEMTLSATPCSQK